MKTLKELLDQNPVVKATLYVLAAMLPEISESLTQWTSTPPSNEYEIASLVVRALFAGVVTLKAFTSNPSGKSDIK